MGFRFRRRLKLGPGVYWNVTGNSLFSSLTFRCGKNVHINVPVERKGGTTMSVGNFGGVLTGLSHQSTIAPDHRVQQPQQGSLLYSDIDVVDNRRQQLKDDQDRRWKELIEKQKKV
jgi:hypothetical protein